MVRCTRYVFPVVAFAVSISGVFSSTPLSAQESNPTSQNSSQPQAGENPIKE